MLSQTGMPCRFAVTPLTEACGLIEWVNHTVGLRYCCQSVYKAANLFNRSTNPSIKATYDNYKVRCYSDTIQLSQN